MRTLTRHVKTTPLQPELHVALRVCAECDENLVFALNPRRNSQTQTRIRIGLRWRRGVSLGPRLVV